MNDETVTTLEYRKEQLIEELEHARMRLQELEEQQADLHAREEDLQKQKTALNLSCGDEQQGRNGVLDSGGFLARIIFRRGLAWDLLFIPASKVPRL